MAENMRKPNEHSKAVSAQIRAERAAAGMTREQVYEAAGVSRSTYARIEKGAIVVDVAQLAEVAAVLGLTASEIMRRADERLEANLRRSIGAEEASALDEAIRRNRESGTPSADQASRTGS